MPKESPWQIKINREAQKTTVYYKDKLIEGITAINIEVKGGRPAKAALTIWRPNVVALLENDGVKVVKPHKG